MKALTIHQPWAWGIVEGYKPIENRSWPTRHRGPLLIHSGSSRASMPLGLARYEEIGVVVPSDLKFGSILGLVDLVDCVPAADVNHPLADGPWCWVLENPVKLNNPIPATGRLGLWSLSPGQMRLLAREIKSSAALCP